MNKELIEKTSVIKATALFNKSGTDRYLLRYEWDKTKPSAVIIMSMASSATEMIYDQTCMLCHNGAVRNDLGSISIVNLTSSIGNPQPKQDKQNLSVIQHECEKADIIIIAFGRGTSFQKEKEAMLKSLSAFSDKLYTLFDSKGLPYSHPLSPYCHKWILKKI